METITFERLPEAVAELTEKIDKLYSIITNTQPKNTTDQFLTVDEAAKFLNLSKPTIYSKVSKREIPFSKRGKKLYFSRKELETYLQDGRIKTINELEAEADYFLTSKKRKA